MTKKTPEPTQANAPTPAVPNPFQARRAAAGPREPGVLAKIKAAAAALAGVTAADRLKIVTLPSGDWIEDEHTQAAARLHELSAEVRKLSRGITELTMPRAEVQANAESLRESLPPAEILLRERLGLLLSALAGTDGVTLSLASLASGLLIESERLEFGAYGLPGQNSRRAPRGPKFDQRRAEGGRLGEGLSETNK